jgi:hypothetical protein
MTADRIAVPPALEPSTIGDMIRFGIFLIGIHRWVLNAASVR